MLHRLTINFKNQQIFLNGEDVTAELKEENVSMEASNVSTIPDIRNEMVKRQRQIADEYIQKGNVVIAEGRDTGTRLFPDADIKIFLTAQAEIRAKRRQQQLLDQGKSVSFKEVMDDLKKRDYQDQTRSIEPIS